VTLVEWLGIGGFGLTLTSGVGTVMWWAIKRETEYATHDELERMETRIKAEIATASKDGQVDRDRLENRFNQRVNELDTHVQTMTAMWVAKGKD
jgi:hypothetical protein